MPNAYLGDRGIQQQTALPVYTYTLVYIAAMYIQAPIVPAPHTFRNSFEQTAKSKIWPIRLWGGEANCNP